jgi:pre-rRNA-processing protein TSR3
VNYSKLNKLTTAEALAASLFILGFKEQSLELLDKFKWGHTFYELNQNLLKEYSKLENESQIELILKDYGLI